MNLTNNEKLFLLEIKKYINDISEETIYDGKEICQKSKLGPKIARAILSSLTKKEILRYDGLLPQNKHCWNPIYLGKNYNKILEEL